MKFSRFNIFFPYNDVMLGYNTLYETCIVINKVLYQSMTDGFHNDIATILKKHPLLYKTLKNEKFIINKFIDEIKKVKKILQETNNNDDVFEITINPTINCNFKCWYCYESHIPGSKMDIMILERTIKYISSIIKEKENLKTLKIQWFGGEPLLCFNEIVKPILLQINTLAKSKSIKVISNFTTNGYLLNDQMLDFCIHNAVKHFQITLDGHKERHNIVRFTHKGSNTYDKIVSNIIKCIKKKLQVTVRINVSSETKAEIESIIKDFESLTTKERKFICFSIHKVWQETDNILTEVEEYVEKIRENGFECDSFYSNPNTIRNTCYADKKNQVIINYNGNIYKCTARDFTEENREGTLSSNGKIIWNKKHKLRESLNALNYRACTNCPILPLCNAGCSQKKIENKNDFCPYQFDEAKKIAFVKKVVMNKINISLK